MSSAYPPALGPLGGDLSVTTADAWAARRVKLRREFENNIYGPAPAPVTPIVVKREPIAAKDCGGVERVEQWEVDLGAAGRFHLALVRPPGDGPAATIIVQNFCGLRAAFPGHPKAIAPPRQVYPCIMCSNALEPALRSFLGRYINGPPFELIASRGYALALFYAGDIVPDRPKEARAALARFAQPETGALMGWAWTHARALDVLIEDERLDPARMMAWGQSRNGKAALLAAAFDDRFAAAASFQSGRGGDALTSHRKGESVSAIVRQFPHWFAPHFRRYKKTDPPIDQHLLLALLAPRPLLLGMASAISGPIPKARAWRSKGRSRCLVSWAPRRRRISPAPAGTASLPRIGARPWTFSMRVCRGLSPCPAPNFVVPEAPWSN